jgi:hypothetical protein
MDVKGIDSGKFQFSADKQQAPQVKAEQQESKNSTDSVVVALSASSAQLAQIALSGEKSIEKNSEEKPQSLDIEI